MPSSIILPRGDPHFLLLALIPSMQSLRENHWVAIAITTNIQLGIGSFIVRWQVAHIVNITIKVGNYPRSVIVFAEKL